jgi:hypothetical protein
MKESAMTTKDIAVAECGEPKTAVDRGALALILAFTVLGGTLALAQASKPQTTNSADAHAKTFDRCPYYPSPIFCRSDSRSGEHDEISHNADDR